MGDRIKTAAAGVTDQWYNGEMTKWDFYGMNDPPASASLYDWGHFTQVVWKDASKVGCATVRCGPGSVLSLQSWYTVCNYNPPGETALPLLFDTGADSDIQQATLAASMARTC